MTGWTEAQELTACSVVRGMTASPVAMMTRLSAGGVPFWQLFLSAALLAATAGLVMRLVAGMFRAQILLTGQPFSFRRLARALAGRPPELGGELTFDERRPLLEQAWDGFRWVLRYDPEARDARWAARSA